MDKFLGLSHYEHNYNLIDVGLYDYKNQSEYVGLFKLKDEKYNHSFDDFRDYYQLLIPVNDSVFKKISKIGRLKINSFQLNDFLKEYSLEEWMI